MVDRPLDPAAPPAAVPDALQLRMRTGWSEMSFDAVGLAPDDPGHMRPVTVAVIGIAAIHGVISRLHAQ
jgi:hypothetical protein